MRCFVLITLVQGLSGQPIDAKRSYLNRDLAFLVIPVKPNHDSPNAQARAAITTTKGVFYVRETAEEVIGAECVDRQAARAGSAD